MCIDWLTRLNLSLDTHKFDAIYALTNLRWGQISVLLEDGDLLLAVFFSSKQFMAGDLRKS